MTPGTQVSAPGMTDELCATTDPEYYDEHAESVELWSPGNPIFSRPETMGETHDVETGVTLATLLD